MAFPANPEIGQVHFSATESWKWNGVSWISQVNRNAVTLGGQDIAVSDPQENDMLRFNSGAWRNISQVEVTDGGNF
jgi:hypothetical protein